MLPYPQLAKRYSNVKLYRSDLQVARETLETYCQSSRECDFSRILSGERRPWKFKTFNPKTVIIRFNRAPFLENLLKAFNCIYYKILALFMGLKYVLTMIFHCSIFLKYQRNSQRKKCLCMEKISQKKTMRNTIIFSPVTADWFLLLFTRFSTRVD